MSVAINADCTAQSVDTSTTTRRFSSAAVGECRIEYAVRAVGSPTSAASTLKSATAMIATSVHSRTLDKTAMRSLYRDRASQDDHAAGEGPAAHTARQLGQSPIWRGVRP